MKRSEIVTEARRYVTLKTPWKRYGRSDKGLDCGGIVTVVMEHFGLTHEPYTGSVKTPDGKQLVRLLTDSLIVVHPPLKQGMVILLHNMGSPWHLAFMSELFGQPSMIHVGANRRYTSEESFGRDMEKRLHMAFDFPGVED